MEVTDALKENVKGQARESRAPPARAVGSDGASRAQLERLLRQLEDLDALRDDMSAEEYERERKARGRAPPQPRGSTIEARGLPHRTRAPSSTSSRSRSPR